MDSQNTELIEKIRQQFDAAPYPRTPLETSPKNNYELLYNHNLITSYYLRNKKVINTEGKLILDAGCGTGYKSLILAMANPGASIVGVDLSQSALDLAKQRLEYYQIEKVDFYCLSIQDLPSLNQQFDYINCDDVLYLLTDIAEGLKALKSVLKPDGIIRTNLHSRLQREQYYRVQQLFQMMGLMDNNPEELEINIAREIMESLKDNVVLKASTWNPQSAKEDEWMRMNYLFQGDTGYTIPQIFTALRKADLEFINMVNWSQWEILYLFKEPENLPSFLDISLPEISQEEKLHLFELLHPVHRLIDFWCGHPDQSLVSIPLADWTDDQWRSAQVHLHPQIANDQAKKDLIEGINISQGFEISRYVPSVVLEPLGIEANMASCLLPLWDGPQALSSLVERWLKVHPVDPVSLEKVSLEVAFEEVKGVITKLEKSLYVLIE